MKNKQKIKRKAESDCARCGLENQLNTGGIYSDFQSENNINTEKLQSDIFSNLIQHRKVIRLDQRCAGCKNFFAAKKMSRCPSICRKCFAAAQDKGTVALGNFIAKATSNFQRIVREALKI